MPFPTQAPRPFKLAEIEALTPGELGCYGLFQKPPVGDDFDFIYIGRGDMRDRLLSHLNGETPCIARQRPSHFVTEVTQNPRQREAALLVEHAPFCNQKAD